MRKTKIVELSIDRDGLSTAEEILYRMAATVYPDECKTTYNKFERTKCYYWACMGILIHTDPHNRILILGEGIPKHAILVDRNNRILVDSYKSRFISWHYPKYVNAAEDRHGKKFSNESTVIADIQASDLRNWCTFQKY